MGRELEMAALGEVFADAADGTPQVVLIEGEAGIGKTTLVERFLERCGEDRILRASGEETERGVSFAIVDQLMRSAGAGTVDVLGAGDHLTVGLELIELLGASDGGRRTVVVIDDAHLADEASVRALLFCARRLSESATLFVLVVRGSAAVALPEGWLKLADESVLRPRPLLADDARSLAEETGVALTAGAAERLVEHTGGNPLHLRAVLRELPATGSWLHDDRSLPVPRRYAQLVDVQLRRFPDDVVALLHTLAVLGVRAQLHAVLELAELADPLPTIDRAVDTGLVAVAEREDGTWLVFTHPLTRAAVHEAMPHARREQLHRAAAELAPSAEAALHHRVEATAGADDALLAELEAAARAYSARGAWAGAIRALLAARRVATDPSDRERLTLDAIETLMYSGDGGAARRLADHSELPDSVRRDTVWAYLAMFAGDLDVAEQRLDRAWAARGEDPRLAATIAQRRAFLASSRLRGEEAIEWAERAIAMLPGDPGTAMLATPSLANGLAFAGRIDEAHATLDRWLMDRDAPAPGSGYVLLTLKARLLEAQGEIRSAEDLFARASDVGLKEGLLVVAGMALAGHTRVQFLAGAWDDAVVSAQRAVAVATESEDRWVLAQAQWAASLVATARGDLESVQRLAAVVVAERAEFERHTALQALFAAQVAAAQERPADVLEHLRPVVALQADFTVLPWQHLHAHALVDLERLDEASAFIDEAAALATARRYPLLAARLLHARARVAIARHGDGATEAFEAARELLESLEMPYERAIVALAHAQLLRREGRRRVASELLLEARKTFTALSAQPALRRCEQELTACGLRPAVRSTRDYARLTPQETAVTRLVVAGMTNREVAKELMLSAKTVEFHLRNVYLKLGVRSRTELRGRARGNDIQL
ncbi:LuxR C-terminal-related transcriptional regulator [Solirubrobacter phytolaccae]|uniref:LuxR C-terminal-related transcriptional regulator n=1 Tax=Solirubrobacter phytolaccae TaxID=1404360 RepID=A0A9X3N7U4_9ACTN|nr:LuxR family transcriptional regulator [Solirubrobacter phytolaccae]MDA0181343.1 LuxR C-terminal-related transcriptional regulator [Solirubrobacter phytolaccae]